MYQLFETIRIEEGKIQNLDYHQSRVDYTFKNLFPGKTPQDLRSLLKEVEIISLPGINKCRVSYNEEAIQINIEPYFPNPPSSLKLIEDSTITYEFKFENRDILNALFDRRSGMDDVLIVKHGLATDTSYGNILFGKKGNWLTPHLPLLKGTQRAMILEKKIAVEEVIRTKDIYEFEYFMVINAMLPFNEDRAIPIQMIEI